MLGRQHLMLSVATVTILLVPLLEKYLGFALVMFLGAGIGSLIPDVDAKDAAVFHGSIKGLNGNIGSIINISIAPLLPYFGYSTKYLIFKPAVKILNFLTPEKYNFEAKHRKFTHSILGVFTLATMTGLYLTPVLLYLKIFQPLYLLAFLTAYMFGAFLHMVQDSCTKTGIAWNSPFSEKKLKGNLSTGKDIRKPRFFLIWLGALIPASFYFTHGYSSSLVLSVSAAFASALLSWLVFMKLVSKVKLET